MYKLSIYINIYSKNFIDLIMSKTFINKCKLVILLEGLPNNEYLLIFFKSSLCVINVYNFRLSLGIRKLTKKLKIKC